jgi:Protein of unknown function (DUF2934)
MAKARTPRTTKATTSNTVLTMPEAGSVSLVRKTAPLNSSPDLEAKIRERAYQLYQERGSTPGFENEDWLKAEREIRARQSHQQTA